MVLVAEGISYWNMLTKKMASRATTGKYLGVYER
jgi:hypothetical protein